MSTREDLAGIRDNGLMALEEQTVVSERRFDQRIGYLGLRVKPPITLDGVK